MVILNSSESWHQLFSSQICRGFYKGEVKTVVAPGVHKAGPGAAVFAKALPNWALALQLTVGKKKGFKLPTPHDNSSPDYNRLRPICFVHVVMAPCQLTNNRWVSILTNSNANEHIFVVYHPMKMFMGLLQLHMEKIRPKGSFLKVRIAVGQAAVLDADS